MKLIMLVIKMMMKDDEHKLMLLEDLMTVVINLVMVAIHLMIAAMNLNAHMIVFSKKLYRTTPMQANISKY